MAVEVAVTKNDDVGFSLYSFFSEFATSSYQCNGLLSSIADKEKCTFIYGNLVHALVMNPVFQLVWLEIDRKQTTGARTDVVGDPG